ncbi:MAG: polysaccharide biosynthesis/export family protein [Phycisphaerales bacterium]
MQPASNTSQRRTLGRSLLTLGLAGSLLATIPGCTNSDSFMDPSVTGRWERTPTKVPILTHLAAIEDEDTQYVEITDITPSDLLPEAEAYRVGPGDFLNITAFDLIQRNVPELLQRTVDENGYIEIPQLGRIFVNGLTEPEVAREIESYMADIINDPDVSVVVAQRRQQLFHLMGAVNQPGPYLIPASDYRLLQALVSAGGFPEYVKEVYIIRQVPLTDEARGRAPESPGDFSRPPSTQSNNTDDPDAEDLLDVIDDLSAPSVVGAGGEFDRVPSFETLERARLAERAEWQPEPIIDLIDPNDDNEPRGDIAGVGDPSRPAQAPRWIFREGEWVRVRPAGEVAVTPASSEMDPMDVASGLVTQRVIRVPVKPLVSGDARYNVIVRPGDVVRVPPAPTGNIYIDGQVVRPGVYQLPFVGGLTLQRALTSAGGLNGLAIPERVDLTRMVGPDEEATIMLNLRAIAEGTQPDLYLKPNDRINVGTNFWATPLAVIRGGFRASYGFGFLLDRNFGNDVFGAPPTNVGN